MFTVEQLMNASHHPSSVISKAEAQERMMALSRMMAFSRQGTFISVISVCNRNHGIVFFTNDHCFGIGVLPKDFFTCTSVLPENVAPRKGLESGVITNIDEYIAVYYDDCRIIESTQELVDYMNNEYAHVNVQSVPY